jgi:chemotaxis protein CheD
MNHIIGIGDYAITSHAEDTLETYALASCVGVTVYSPAKKVAGMMHIALPNDFGIKEDILRPGYYATVGIPFLIKEMQYKYGCFKNELDIQIFGGALSIRENDFFNIGAKNLEMIKKIFLYTGVNYKLTDVGGYMSRTIKMDAATGAIKIYTQPIKI